MNKRALRILCILLCAVTMLCSCGKAEVDDATVGSETATDNAVEHTKSHKGLTLSVYVPERVAHGEEFPVVARITNDSDNSITYTRSATGENMHLEIETVIIGSGGKRFIDCDTVGKPLMDAASGGTLKPKESFEQNITFLPGWTSDGSVGLSRAEITMFDSGSYMGSATFRWDTDGGEESISLEFPVTVY